MGDRSFAKPGDTVRITYPDSYDSGKEYVVIECPQRYLDHPWNVVVGLIWIKRQFPHGRDKSYLCWRPECYEIVRRSDKSEQDGKDVDKSLARQMDDNLKGVFG